MPQSQASPTLVIGRTYLPPGALSPDKVPRFLALAARRMRSMPSAAPDITLAAAERLMQSPYEGAAKLEALAKLVAISCEARDTALAA